MSSRAVTKVNVQIVEVISVFDNADNGVTGLVNTDFTKFLYKDGVVDATAVTVTEIANGDYKITWTPTSTANDWHLRVSQAIYDKRGWQMTYTVTTDGVLTLSDIQAYIDAHSTKLDATVSSRATPANITAATTNLDAPVSSRATLANITAATTNLDAPVSSRATPADITANVPTASDIASAVWNTLMWSGFTAARVLRNVFAGTVGSKKTGSPSIINYKGPDGVSVITGTADSNGDRSITSYGN